MATLGVTFLLITIFEHKQEARQTFVKVVEVDEVSTDPEPWALNWPDQFDSYRRTVDKADGELDTSNVLTQSKLEEHPWLKRLYAGYAFSIDYRELRGHAYMLHDQEVTRRVSEASQSGACLHCHASVVPTYRRLGMAESGQEPTLEELRRDFNWPAVMAGFKKMSTLPYERKGAAKVTNHWIRSPMENINNACQTCHKVPEQELRDRVHIIQKRTTDMIELAAAAMVDMLDAINQAQAAGATDAEMAPILELQRKATWRLDFIISENSKGFHADQEAVRILGESIDYSRKATNAALRLLQAKPKIARRP